MSDLAQERAERIEEEYFATLKVLAVLVERLLVSSQGDVIEIGEQALMDSPDLTAWRDAPRQSIMLQASR